MLTIILDIEELGTRKVFKNLTVAEFANKLSELSKIYVLVYDTAMDIVPTISCAMYFTAVSKR